jgi:hypothetical protein
MQAIALSISCVVQEILRASALFQKGVVWAFRPMPLPFGTPEKIMFAAFLSVTTVKAL